MSEPAAQADVSVYDHFAPLYRAAGLRVVPIGPRTKYPCIHMGGGAYMALAGWTTREPVLEPQPDAGIGLLCGTPLIAADIDTNDESIGVELIDALVSDSDNGVVITKIGQRGQTLLLRPPLDVAVRSRKFLIDGKCVFEMLAEGRQTVLPPTQHPDLKQPYRWGNGATPLNTELERVAFLRPDWLERVEGVLCRHGYQKETEPEPAKGFDDSSPFHQLNQVALADLTRWVCDLGLYKFRRGRGYLNYEAVAQWRPSSTGRPLEQRNPNLKISPKRGIVDFGTGKGYSPLDLVMAARGYSLNEAFDWLQGKLGPDAKERVIEFEAPAKETPRQEEKPRLRFKLVSFSAMRPRLEQLYLVDELVPVAGLVDIWGPPKCFKSFWTLDLMLHVAKGWEYRDRCVHQGAVVYCAFEGGHGYKKRIEALRRHYEIPQDEEVPLYIMPGQANLIGEHKVLIEDIKVQLGAVRPVAVVLDTLNKSLLGSESKDEGLSHR
jgi:AAA domain-containing protein/bifunctional DNA primase/polymerase-like protein